MNSSYKAEDLQYYKFGHSIAFEADEIASHAPLKVRPGDPQYLPKAATLPAIVPDLSVDMTEERARRQKIHEEVLQKDKGAFRR